MSDEPADRERTIDRLEIRESTLVAILDLLEDPEECYPRMDDAQSFFEMNWDLVERLGEHAKRLGLKSTWEDDEEEEEEEEPDGEHGPEEGTA